MDFKQRFLTALNHEEPDRVPVMGLVLDAATVNQVLGRKPTDVVGLLKQPVIGPMLKRLMNVAWYSDRVLYQNTAGALESAIKLGFDANWTIYFSMRLERDPLSPLGMAFHDVWGRVWEMGGDGKGNMTLNYTRALCTTEAEWEARVEHMQPMFERILTGSAAFHKRLAEAYGDRILVIGYACPGVFENSWQPVGFVEFTKLVYQKPDFVKRMIAFHTQYFLRYLEGVLQCGVDVVLGGDDLGQKTGPLMRPELIERFYGESYRRISALVHQHKKKLIWHSCGNIYKFLDKFIDWGFDGIITMEPTAGMDLATVREQVGHKLVLVGNLDVSHLLVKGSRDEVEAAVKQAIQAAGRGGGYILSPSHSHAFVDATRLQWMVEAAHRWGRYPLSP